MENVFFLGGVHSAKLGPKEKAAGLEQGLEFNLCCVALDKITNIPEPQFPNL